MPSEIVWMSKGMPTTLSNKGEIFRSGISKHQVDILQITPEQIIGDDVANHEYHGGTERVICFYPFEHYTYWEDKYKRSLPKSAFGENITMTNMTEDTVCVGDIYQIGEVIIQISQGRYPCSTINKYTNIHTLLKHIIEKGYTGYFSRILQPGTIAAQSEIKLIEKHPKEISIAAIHDTYFHNQNDLYKIEEILSIEELASEWKNRFLKLYDSSSPK